MSGNKKTGLSGLWSVNTLRLELNLAAVMGLTASIEMDLVAKEFFV